MQLRFQVYERLNGIKGKNEGIDVAWVAFRDRNAAAEAMQTLWVLHPDLSVDWAKSDSAEDQMPAGEPNHTLCIIGFKGDKYDLRRHLGKFRQAIRDVRIREYHTYDHVCRAEYG